jgi:hypothetical protein
MVPKKKRTPIAIAPKAVFRSRKLRGATFQNLTLLPEVESSAERHVLKIVLYLEKCRES